MTVCSLNIAWREPKRVAATSLTIKRCFDTVYSLFININQLDALNFMISLFQASTCFEHMCSPSGGQKLYYTVSGIITLKQVSGVKLLK